LKTIKSNSVLIENLKPLRGTVSAQGSKNATLPILSSLPLLTEVELYNVPDLSDIHEMLSILSHLGAKYQFNNGHLKMDLSQLEPNEISFEFTSKMRASSLFMGPLLSRFGHSAVGMPGGCVIGSRPLDIHTNGFKQLGAEVVEKDGFVTADSRNSGGLQGEFTLPFPSVGATQNLISASVFSPSTVTLHNVAVEPEVMEMIHFLNKAGAKIELVGSNTLLITGVKKLNKVSHTIQADRIEVFTLLVAGIISKGSVTVVNCEPKHLTAPLEALVQMGAKIEITKDTITASYVGPLNGIRVETGVYPAFPTDCQQQISIVMLHSDTPSTLVEKVFNNRFRHLDELQKMGAKIKIENNEATIERSELSSATLDSFDLRGAASMILAGISTNGITRVNSLHYLYRGYEGFVEKLNHLGADIAYM
jgi:UDP-N-acetylglucosamine 1-carboxyvinyltransferase